MEAKDWTKSVTTQYKKLATITLLRQNTRHQLGKGGVYNYNWLRINAMKAYYALSMSSKVGLTLQLIVQENNTHNDVYQQCYSTKKREHRHEEGHLDIWQLSLSRYYRRDFNDVPRAILGQCWPDSEP